MNVDETKKEEGLESRVLDTVKIDMRNVIVRFVENNVG